MAERPIHKNTHQSEIKSEIKAFPYVVYLLQSRRGKTRGCPGAGWGRGRSIGSPSPPGRPSTSHQPWYSWIRLPLPLCKKKKKKKKKTAETSIFSPISQFSSDDFYPASLPSVWSCCIHCDNSVQYKSGTLLHLTSNAACEPSMSVSVWLRK